jgi:hypothetical protein
VPAVAPPAVPDVQAHPSLEKLKFMALLLWKFRKISVKRKVSSNY